MIMYDLVVEKVAEHVYKVIDDTAARDFDAWFWKHKYDGVSGVIIDEHIVLLVDASKVKEPIFALCHKYPNASSFVAMDGRPEPMLRGVYARDNFKLLEV